MSAECSAVNKKKGSLKAIQESELKLSHGLKVILKTVIQWVPQNTH